MTPNNIPALPRWRKWENTSRNSSSFVERSIRLQKSLSCTSRHDAAGQPLLFLHVSSSFSVIFCVLSRVLQAAGRFLDVVGVDLPSWAKGENELGSLS